LRIRKYGNVGNSSSNRSSEWNDKEVKIFLDENSRAENLRTENLRYTVNELKLWRVVKTAITTYKYLSKFNACKQSVGVNHGKESKDEGKHG
jgi:hypothetical protein